MAASSYLCELEMPSAQHHFSFGAAFKFAALEFFVACVASKGLNEAIRDSLNSDSGPLRGGRRRSKRDGRHKGRNAPHRRKISHNSKCQVVGGSGPRPSRIIHIPVWTTGAPVVFICFNRSPVRRSSVRNFRCRPALRPALRAGLHSKFVNP
jgi:hypothetical protein